MNKDDDIAIDALREYLKLNGYKSTLDCLEKELKVVEANEKSNKNKVSEYPQIFRILKIDSQD
jgi:hypothetical protein